MEVQAQWLEEEPPPSSRRGPPRLPGLPDIPPMPVAPAEPAPTNKTIEVEPQWLEIVKERRAAKKPLTNQAEQEAAPQPPTAPKPPVRPVAPRIRPIIPREDD